MIEANDSKFGTRKWNIVSDANCDVGNEALYNTEVLKSNFNDYNNAYIPVRGDTTIAGNIESQVGFQNCATYAKCITKINGTKIDDDEDVDLVKVIYNFLKYSSNYSDTTGSLCFFSKDYAANFNDNITDDDNIKSFKYKTELTGATNANGLLEECDNCCIIKINHLK